MKFALNRIAVFILYFFISVSSPFETVSCKDDIDCQHPEICTQNKTCTNILSKGTNSSETLTGDTNTDSNNLNRLKRSAIDKNKDNKDVVKEETIEDVKDIDKSITLTNLTSQNHSDVLQSVTVPIVNPNAELPPNATSDSSEVRKAKSPTEAVTNERVAIAMTKENMNETEDLLENVIIELSDTLQNNSIEVINSNATFQTTNSTKSFNDSAIAPKTKKESQKSAKSMDIETGITTDDDDTTEATLENNFLDFRSILYDRMRYLSEKESNNDSDQIPFSTKIPISEIEPRAASSNDNKIKQQNDYNSIDNSQQYTPNMPLQTFTEGNVAAFFRPNTFKETFSQLGLFSLKNNETYLPPRGRSMKRSIISDDGIAETNIQEKCPCCSEKLSDTKNKRMVKRDTEKDNGQKLQSDCSGNGAKNGGQRKIVIKKRRNRHTTTAPTSSLAPVDFRRTTLAEEESESQEE